MSPTPVREALSRLSQEKIIDTQEQRGFFVKQIELSEIAELYALIHLNTAFLMRRLAAHEALPSVADRISAIYTAQTPLAASRQLFRFCDHLDRHADSPNAAQTLHNLYLRTQFARLVEFSEARRHRTMRGIARDISEAARAGRRRVCYQALDSLYLKRAEWLEHVREHARSLAERVSSEHGLNDELRKS